MITTESVYMASELEKGDKFLTMHTQREGVIFGRNPVVVMVRFSDRHYPGPPHGLAYSTIHPDVKLVRID